MTGLSNLFDKPAYSDITIRFGDQEIRAHKAVICEQLKYFDKLCGANSAFKEADQRIVELHDDSPDAIRALLLSLYERDYREERDESANGYDLEFLVNVYVAASKYGHRELRDEVMRDLKSTANPGYLNREEPTLSDLLTAMSLVFDSSLGGDDRLNGCFRRIYSNILYRGGAWEDVPRMQPAERKPHLKFLSARPELAQHFVEDLAKEEEMVAVNLYQCTGCGKVSSDEEDTCSGETAECQSASEPATYFRIKCEGAAEADGRSSSSDEHGRR